MGVPLPCLIAGGKQSEPLSFGIIEFNVGKTRICSSHQFRLVGLRCHHAIGV